MPNHLSVLMVNAAGIISRIDRGISKYPIKDSES